MTAALLAIVKILGIVVLICLGAAVLALFVPVHAKCVWDKGNFTLRGGILWLSVPLYPRHHRPKRQTAPPKNPPAKAQPPAPRSQRRENAQKAIRILASSGWAVKKLCRSVKIREATILYTHRGEDAAQTALETGRLHAYLGTIYGIAEKLFDVRVGKICVQPDFAGEVPEQKHFSCKITVRLYIIISIIGYIVWKAARAEKQGSRI